MISLISLVICEGSCLNSVMILVISQVTEIYFTGFIDQCAGGTFPKSGRACELDFLDRLVGREVINGCLCE